MELVCYTYEGWAPRLRPASPKRDWMEGTPELFAYRCLPLAIANAHGWEILSPCGFEARWTGGEGLEAVEIRLDPGADQGRAPVCMFGQGVLTFHVEGLFRTSGGWNLWVGGPPNAAKDGIAPLGGVIETDWSPYTFTMNWRFTRADHWIRFEENEPFCFFFPVERARLSEIEPEIKRIEDAPELKAAFEAWSLSREALRHKMRETNPQAPADNWQKLYYRGVQPDGSDGPADHVSKLRLHPFRLPDGGALETGECPVRGPARTPAAVIPAPKAAAPVGVSDFSLNLDLRRLGFEAEPRVPVKTGEHWREVYCTQAPDRVSWHQPTPEPSLGALDRFDVASSASLIDVGGGASTLVDCLIERGWSDLTMLDIAAPALEAARARLGDAAEKVQWVTADITIWRPGRTYDVWHDRALFHFLTGADQRAAYRRALEAGVAPGGLAVVATFAPDGPERCSGLPVRRYDPAGLAEEIGPGFRLVDHWREVHATPNGSSQAFTWCVFRRA